MEKREAWIRKEREENGAQKLDSFSSQLWQVGGSVDPRRYELTSSAWTWRVRLKLLKLVVAYDTLKGESPKFKNVNTCFRLCKQHVCVCMFICVGTRVYIFLHAL